MSKAIGTASQRPRVFISYSGNEFDFADQLEKALLYGGFSITAGRPKILGVDDWQQRLSQLIDASESIVCVLSPTSATDNICRWEFEEAVRLNKRTVCVSCYPLDQISLTLRARSPELISFYADKGSPGSGFGAGLQRLGVALTADLGSRSGYPQLLRAAGDHQAGRNLDGERKPSQEMPRRNVEMPMSAAAGRRRKVDGTGRSSSIIQVGVLALLTCAAVVGYDLLAQQQDALRQKDDAEKRLLATQEQIALVKASKRDIERNFREGLKADSYFRAEQAAHTGADAVLGTLLALEGLRDEMSDDERQRTRPFVNATWRAAQISLQNQRERKILNGHTGSVLGATLASDGSGILTFSADETARLWGPAGNLLAILRGHTDIVTSGAFAPDGDRVLTASDDKTARVWSRDGKQLLIMRGHTGPISSAVFAPSGNRMLTAAWDGTARLWDGEGALLLTLQG